MADLEDGGFLYQPHTSAGRVPTAAAYRFFVEQVAAQATASPEDRQWIRRELESAQTPEAVMERASHVLSAVSRGLGIFISPPLARSVVEHLRFLLLPDNRVLVILITSGGQTRDKLIRPERTFPAGRSRSHRRSSEPALRRLDAGGHARRSARAGGARPRAVRPHRRRRADALRPRILGDSSERKVYVEGAAQIASSREFTDQDQLRELLEAIEEKDRLIALAERLHRSARAGARGAGARQNVQRRKTPGAGFGLVFIQRSGAGNARDSRADAHALRAGNHGCGFHGAIFFRKINKGVDLCLHTNDKVQQDRIRTKAVAEAPARRWNRPTKLIRPAWTLEQVPKAGRDADPKAAERKAGTDEHAGPPPGGFRELPEAHGERAPARSPPRHGSPRRAALPVLDAFDRALENADDSASRNT